jgi:hypothetical protein
MSKHTLFCALTVLNLLVSVVAPPPPPVAPIPAPPAPVSQFVFEPSLLKFDQTEQFQQKK